MPLDCKRTQNDEILYGIMEHYYRPSEEAGRLEKAKTKKQYFYCTSTVDSRRFPIKFKTLAFLNTDISAQVISNFKVNS